MQEPLQIYPPDDFCLNCGNALYEGIPCHCGVDWDQINLDIKQHFENYNRQKDEKNNN